METELDVQATIINEFCQKYKDSGEFDDFFKYATYGVPLAFLIAEGVLDLDDDLGDNVWLFLHDTWEKLLKMWDMKDTGFKNYPEFAKATFKAVANANK